MTSNLWQLGGFLRVLHFILPRYNLNIVESVYRHTHHLRMFYIPFFLSFFCKQNIIVWTMHEHLTDTNHPSEWVSVTWLLLQRNKILQRLNSNSSLVVFNAAFKNNPGSQFIGLSWQSDYWSILAVNLLVYPGSQFIGLSWQSVYWSILAVNLLVYPGSQFIGKERLSSQINWLAKVLTIYKHKIISRTPSYEQKLKQQTVLILCQIHLNTYERGIENLSFNKIVSSTPWYMQKWKL